MKKKLSKSSKPTPTATYFSKERNYSNLVEQEAQFFTRLLAAKDEFQGNLTVRQALQNTSGFLQDPTGRDLSISVSFDVTDFRGKSNAPQKLFLGTRLQPRKSTDPNQNPQFTQYFCLAEGGKLLTRVHFDREFTLEAAEKKPCPHIQFGGRPGALMNHAAHMHWVELVDKPRIPSMPFCSALLWHWAFLEYQHVPEFARILRKPWWNETVKHAEASILNSFFSDGRRLIEYQPHYGLLNAFYTECAIS
jgi:hypothetical protein